MEFNEKVDKRQNTIHELNNEILKLKQKSEQSEIRLQQFQSINDTSVINKYEQQIDDLQKTLALKINEAEV
ncbi:unnamed protein product, partial [Adineta steineri]